MSELIDRQALKNKICDCCEGKDEWCNGPCFEIMIIDSMPAIASPWHRVEDGLPPKATWVLTVAMEGNVKLFNIATVDAGGQWWTCSPQNIMRELYRVCYWMPIEPPKEDA